MMKSFLRPTVASLAFAHIALAGNVKVHGNVNANNQTTPQVVEGDHVVHFVSVGKATNNFQPNSIVAAPGDIVMFQFYPTNHSVIRAAYGYPCIPYDYVASASDAVQMFDSGFQPIAAITDNPPSWNLTINDTQPIFYYCGAPGSCTDWGMVGGINLNASTPLSNQIGLAREADYMLLPGEPFPNEQQQASMASLAATATTATFTVTEMPSSSSEYGSGYNHGQDSDPHDEYHEESQGLSTGAIAGIAVGSAAGAAALVGLIWMLLRMRKLKRKNERLENQQQYQPPMGTQGGMYPQGNMPSHQSRHISGLPPYQGHVAGTDMYKPPENEGYAASDVPSRGMSPHNSVSPYNMQGQFVGFDGAQNNRYTTHSELSGPPQPMIELAAPRPGSPHSPH